MAVMTNPLPAPARFHQDGWTPDVQTLFLDRLMTTGSIREAARACGKTASAAYKLREHPNGAAFKAAWLRAIGVCMERVRETAIDRAFNGRIMPILNAGMQIGEELVFNDRLLITLMRLYDAPAYHAKGAHAAQLALLPPTVPMSHDEIIATFEAAMDKVRLTQAARDTEMAKLISAEAPEPALEPALGDADPGVSKESQKRDDPGVSKESQNRDDACKRPASTRDLIFRQPAQLRRSRVHKSGIRAKQKQRHPALAP
jgi:hypothetical protein